MFAVTVMLKGVLVEVNCVGVDTGPSSGDFVAVVVVALKDGLDWTGSRPSWRMAL